MYWMNLGITVLTMIVKYGPQLWRLGVSVYKVVDEIIADMKRRNPKIAPEEVKTIADTKFDQLMAARAAGAGVPLPAHVTRTQLRRDVWGTRPENYKKVTTGKTAGRPGGRRPN